MLTCTVCQRNKPRQRKAAGLLQSTETPNDPFECLSFDLVTDLPKTERGFDSVAVFVDPLTKLGHFVPTTKTVDAVGFAHLYLNNVFKHHGLSDKFISDRDPRFTSKFWTELTRLIGTRLALSSSYHAQTDGLTERLNRTLETYLRHFVSADQSDWDTLLPMAEFAYNSAWQESVKASPFELTFGRQPKAPVGRIPISLVPGATSFAERISLGLSKAKASLAQAQARQKTFADQKRREVSYEVGDSVLLSSKNLPIRFTGSGKLLPRYVGPFKVVQRIGSLAYKLDLPAHYRIHPVFHVSLIEPYRADGRYQPPPPPTEIEGALEYEVDRILSHRYTRKGKRRFAWYLIAWKNYGPEHNSWEPVANLTNAKLSLKEYWQRARTVSSSNDPPLGRGAAKIGGTARVTRKRPASGSTSVGKNPKRQRR